ncbi:MAG: hypothetical protein MUC62_01000 [Candidatus Thermoplasmatota archaeon]|jgi:selenocysteine-specific translation elongation factor|nr:hypothetical protein [Candidatus Thermoplasmatota archaeon]
MDSTTVCLLGPLEWARSIGKETSDTSFGVSAIKRDDRVINIIYPSKYPDKIWSLPFSLYLTDRVYLKVEKLDRELGETVIALDLLGKKCGSINIDPLLDRHRLSTMLKGTVVEGYREFDPNPAVFREELTGIGPKYVEGTTRVVVDQAFNVKGVGCVALGFVTSGSVKKHQELSIAPGTGSTQVRSIQVQDRDFDSAPVGTRVGLALKGVEPEDVPRGSCLHSNDPGVLQGSNIDMVIRTSRFWKEPVLEGAKLHMTSGLQFVPMTIGPTERTGPGPESAAFKTTITTESPICYSKGERFSICFLDSRSFRVIASGESF